jgi:hypothetical protein
LHSQAHDRQIRFVVFALVIGLIVNHTIVVPEWLREAVRIEYYIKTGLVVLGAGLSSMTSRVQVTIDRGRPAVAFLQPRPSIWS